MNEGAFSGKEGMQLRRALMVAAWLLVAIFALGIVYLGFTLHTFGETIYPAKTITVSGEGMAYAVPDTAQFSFSVVSTKPTVAAAQQDAATVSNTITSYLTGAGVAAADIQTTDYEVNPQYEYQNAVCPEIAPAPGVISSPVYCPSGKQMLTGYQVSQTTQVTVRDTSQAGTLLSNIGGKGATNVSGLTFTVGDPTVSQMQARDKAIANAKTAAEDLAKQLGVSLGAVVSFSDNSDYSQPPQPMYSAASNGLSAAATPPTISAGQNQVTSDVSVTYEIH